MNESGMNEMRFGRRRVFQAVGALAAASAGGSLLAACGGSDDDAGGAGPTTGGGTAPGGGGQATSGSSASTAPSGGGGGVLPAFQSFTLAKPDLVGDPQKGIPDAYLKMPATDLTQVYSSPPAAGGDAISILKIIDGAPPTPLNQNKYWQELNKRVGAELKMTNIVAADYQAKLATTVAGGNLPDIMQMQTGYIANAGQFLTNECQDLSEWLSGDAVKTYKGLANFPTALWKNVVFNGGIYGIPWAFGVIGSDNKVRQDIADKLGVSTEPANGDEFMAMCKALTDADKQRWALNTVATAQGMVNEALGVPNAWKVQDGVFTNAWEVDEYKQGLDICNQLWKAGTIYPDSLSSTAGFQQWFAAGKVCIQRDGYTNWSAMNSNGVSADPNFKLGGIVVPKWDGGGQAAHYEGTGMYTFMAVKKQSSKEQVERLLRIFDWFASPVGSKEYFFIKYGLDGHDYTMKDDSPVLTPAGIAEIQNMIAQYMCIPPYAISIAGYPDVTKTDFEYLNKLMQVSAPLPTVGLVSETSLAKGASVNKPVTDAINDIVVGRKKVSDWDGVIKTWKSAGGDQIAKEYTEAYAAAQGS
jgi:putative aldouronate transport system substrate-binding protein